MTTNPQQQQTEVRTCIWCDADLTYEFGVPGWVCTMTGDDGGTYDYCPGVAGHKHVPATTP